MRVTVRDHFRSSKGLLRRIPWQFLYPTTLFTSFSSALPHQFNAAFKTSVDIFRCRQLPPLLLLGNFRILNLESVPLTKAVPHPLKNFAVKLCEYRTNAFNRPVDRPLPVRADPTTEGRILPHIVKFDVWRLRRLPNDLDRSDPFIAGNNLLANLGRLN